MLPWLLRAKPVRPVAELSAGARELVLRCFEDVDASRLLDVHFHVVGIGDGDTGCRVNPDMRSHGSPIRRVKYEAYLAASGLEERGSVDADYLARVLALTSAFPRGARFALLAFDWYYDQTGTERQDLSTFFVPNDYVARLCKEHGQMTFFASVHPYRADAVPELERVAALGATGVKWLPNAMGIDPLDERCSAYFERMRELGLVLLTHAGHELAVDGDEAQALGNPLRLRKPLEHGVTVIIAHCASLGMSEDLDHASRRPVPSFDLFLRLMSDPRYEGRLYGDLSATTLRNREPSVIRTLLERADLYPRLINGSDYPVIAIDPLVYLGTYESVGLLEAKDVEFIREIYGANPLLGDFVLKRRLGLGTGLDARRFPSVVFEGGRLLRPV
jgi:uncharacterized protein